MNINAVIILIIIAVASGIVFIGFPNIDIAFSGLFYSKEKSFFLADNFLVLFLYKSAKYIVTISIITILILTFLNIFPRKNLIFLLIFIIIGPGLFVHTVLKDNWGRARPIDVAEFGGNKKFSPALIITDQCSKNCSFTSGHAAAGFMFAAFGLLLNRRKYLSYSAGIFLGVLFGMGRVLQGKHFISDVVFSGIFVLLIAHLINMLMGVNWSKKGAKKWLK